MFDYQPAIDSARDVLPWWVLWGRCLAWPALAFLITALCAWTGLAIGLMPFRRWKHAAWMQRASDSAAAFYGTRFAALLLPILLAFACYFTCTPLEPMPAWFVATLVGVGAWLGAVVVEARVASEVRGLDLSVGYVVISHVTSWLLLTPNYLLVFALAMALPASFSGWAIVILTIAFGTFIYFCFGGAVSLLCVFGIAWQAPSRLQEIVAAASLRAGVDRPSAFVVRWASANAVASSLGRRVVFSDMALDKLSDEELRAICAHELAHLRESWWISLARVVPGALLLAIGAARPLAGAFGIASVILLGIVFLIACQFVVRLGRRMEVRADGAAAGQDVSAGTYAQALESLYRVNMMPATTHHRRAMHPDLYDRLLAVGITPAQPRPSPPSLDWATAAAVASWIPAIAAAIVAWFTVTTFSATRQSREGPLQLQLIVANSPKHNAEVLSRLAEYRAERGDVDGAIALFRAAAVLEVKNWDYPAILAALLASSDRCDHAFASATEARRRFQSNRGKFHQPIPGGIRDRADWEFGTSFRVIDDALKAVATCRGGD